MKLVNDIYEITRELNQILNKLPLEENREEYISRVEALLEKRGVAIKALPENLTRQQEQIVRNACKMQEVENLKLNNLFKEIEKDLVKTSQMKKFQDKYNTQPLQVDGMFLDKRK